MKRVIRTAAREDILRQYKYYLFDENAEPVAQRFVEAGQAAIDQVCKRPGIGVPKPLANRKLTGLRSWPVKGFPAMRIYYIAADDVLRVVRVLHGKRDLNSLLEDE